MSYTGDRNISTLGALDIAAVQALYGPNSADLTNWSFNATTGVLTQIGDAVANRIDGIFGPDSMVGGAGDDTLAGGYGADTIDGGDGADMIYGTMGADVLTGGPGNDFISGGPGSRLDGGEGGDMLIAQVSFVLSTDYGPNAETAPVATLLGGAGDDFLYAARGRSSIDGGSGRDRIETGQDGGNARFLGTYPNQHTVNGGTGEDTVIGGAGNDVIYGGDDNDSIQGGAGTNFLDGEAGNDTLLGGSGPDQIIGGAGDDVIDGADGVDIADFSSTASNYDVVQLSAGQWQVTDKRAGADGRDLVKNVEVLRFSDGLLTLQVNLPATVETAFANLLRMPANDSKAASVAGNLMVKIAGGASNSQAIAEVLKAADATTSVATMAYQFFTGAIPGQGGVDYLVSPTGPNANNLNSAYYQSFNLENRYINFSVNLGREGEGKAKFLAEYGGLSLIAATKKAYGVIFGATPTDATVTALLSGGRDLYFESYGKDGPNGQGTKAAMVGWLLAEAAKADLGLYAKANDAFLLDLADGATFGVDLIGVYGKPEFNYGG